MKHLVCFLIIFFSLNTSPALATEVDVPAASSEQSLKADTRGESEIALNLESNKKANNSEGSTFRIIFSFSILAIIGVGAYFFLKKYSVPKAMKSQTQIKVLQQHYLGPKKSLAIIRVAGESMLIGITDNNINMLKSLSLLDDEIPEETPHLFNTAMKNSEDDESEDARQDREEFAFGGIKDVVAKRLKGMRSLE